MKKPVGVVYRAARRDDSPYHKAARAERGLHLDAGKNRVAQETVDESIAG
jgi:hypothetical protein